MTIHRLALRRRRRPRLRRLRRGPDAGSAAAAAAVPQHDVLHLVAARSERRELRRPRGGGRPIARRWPPGGRGRADMAAYLSQQAMGGKPAVNARDRIGAGRGSTPPASRSRRTSPTSTIPPRPTSTSTPVSHRDEPDGDEPPVRGELPRHPHRSNADGTAPAADRDLTCGNWTKGGEGLGLCRPPRPDGPERVARGEVVERVRTPRAAATTPRSARPRQRPALLLRVELIARRRGGGRPRPLTPPRDHRPRRRGDNRRAERRLGHRLIAPSTSSAWTARRRPRSPRRRPCGRCASPRRDPDAPAQRRQRRGGEGRPHGDDAQTEKGVGLSNSSASITSGALVSHSRPHMGDDERDQRRADPGVEAPSGPGGEPGRIPAASSGCASTSASAAMPAKLEAM